MHNDGIAEWILRLVMPADRATSTVGDLIEQPQHGMFAFWTAIARIFASSIWSDFRSAPSKIIRLAFQGCLLEILGSAAMSLMAAGTGVVTRTVPWDYLLLNQWFQPTGSPGVMMLVGFWVARRAPGRELTACLALFAIDSFVARRLHSSIGAWQPVWLSAGNCLVMVLTSAVIERKRHLHA